VPIWHYPYPMNETLTVSLESYGPLEDRLKRPENRMQNAHTISRDCNRAQRSLETAKRTLVDHAAESANDKRHSSPLFLPVAILTSLYALNRTLNDARRLSLLQLYYITYCVSSFVAKIKTNVGLITLFKHQYNFEKSLDVIYYTSYASYVFFV